MKLILKPIFHLLATYFVSCDFCLNFDGFYLNIYTLKIVVTNSKKHFDIKHLTIYYLKIQCIK